MASPSTNDKRGVERERVREREREGGGSPDARDKATGGMIGFNRPSVLRRDPEQHQPNGFEA